MKINVILFFSLFSMSFLYSQNKIGINTRNPLNTFHVDGAKDNPLTGNTLTQDQINNDFIFTSDGNVGLNTITPTLKVDLTTSGTVNAPVSGFKLVDGNQSKNKILVGDADGVATWSTLLGGGNPISGAFTWTYNTPINNSNWNTVGNLVVGPGIYTIKAKLHILVDHITDPIDVTSTVQIYIGKKNNGTNNSNVNEVALLGSNTKKNFNDNKDFEVEVIFIYENKTTSNETLYFNFRSDSSLVFRSRYTKENPVAYRGVNLIENYFLATPFTN